MRKPKLREVKQLTQSHLAHKWESQDSNLRLLFWGLRSFCCTILPPLGTHYLCPESGQSKEAAGKMGGLKNMVGTARKMGEVLKF